MTLICVGNLTIIGSDNGLSPDRRQAVIWTNAGILLIQTLGTNFSQILSEIQTFSFKKMHLKMSSETLRPFCLSLNVLTHTSMKLEGGILVSTCSFVSNVVNFTVDVCLSLHLFLHLWTKSCPLCIFHNTCWIHFILNVSSASSRGVVTCHGF